MLNGVNDICQCGFNSSSLQSTDLFSFTCDPTNPSTVTFKGSIYGFSLTNDVDELNRIYSQWINAISPINVFGDILYTGQCEGSTSPPTTTTTSPPTTTTTNSNAKSDEPVGLIIGGILGSFALLASIICCAAVVYFVWAQRKRNQAPVQRAQCTTTKSQSQVHVYSEQSEVNLRKIPIHAEQGPIDPGCNPMPAYNPQYTVTQDYYNQGAETAFSPTGTANMP